MGFNHEKWGKRIQARSDMTGYVYHLTKPVTDANGTVLLNEVERLAKILQERKLNGSSTQSGFITGDRKAVCFQDTPISGLVQNVYHEKVYHNELGGKNRYSYAGLIFPKIYIYNMGGRPVLYERSDIAKSILPSNEHWRIVDFNFSDLNNIVDWTHEREWRLPLDEFHFTLENTTILIADQHAYRYLMELLPADDLKRVQGIVQINPLIY